MPITTSKPIPTTAASPPKSAFPPPLDLTNKSWRTLDKGDGAAILRKNESQSKITRSISPPQSAFPPPIKQGSKRQRDYHRSLVNNSSESSSTISSTPSKQKKENSSLNLNINDDEFAYLAHIILNHFESSSSQASTRASCNEGSSSVFSDVFQYFGTSGGSKRDDTSDENDLMILTPDRLEEFKLALKYRLRQIAPIESREEDSITTLTRQVARTVSMNGFPSPYKGSARIITKASLDSSTSSKRNRSQDRNRNSESQNSSSRDSKALGKTLKQPRNQKSIVSESFEEIIITPSDDKKKNDSRIKPSSKLARSTESYITSSTATPAIPSAASARDNSHPFAAKTSNTVMVETVEEYSDINSTDQSSSIVSISQGTDVYVASANFMDRDIVDPETAENNNDFSQNSSSSLTKKSFERVIDENSFKSSSNLYFSDGQTHETASSIPSSHLSRRSPSAGSPEHIRQQYQLQQEQQTARIYQVGDQYCDLEQDYPLQGEQAYQQFQRQQEQQIAEIYQVEDQYYDMEHKHDLQEQREDDEEPVFEIIEEPEQAILETFFEREANSYHTELTVEAYDSHYTGDTGEFAGIDRTFEEETLVIKENVIGHKLPLNPKLDSQPEFFYEASMAKQNGVGKGNEHPTMDQNQTRTMDSVNTWSSVAESKKGLMNRDINENLRSTPYMANQESSRQSPRLSRKEKEEGHLIAPHRHPEPQSKLNADGKKQNINNEIAHVEDMMKKTTNPAVQIACEDQLRVLRKKSTNIDEERYYQPEECRISKQKIMSDQLHRNANLGRMPRSYRMNETNSIAISGDYYELGSTNPNLVMGRWKDKAWNVFAFGPCHASVIGAIFLPLVALGQVMTRLQVGWFFLPNRSYQHPKDAFRISIGLTMFWITINCLVFYLPPPGLSLTTIISLAVVNAIIYIYYISNVIRVRLRLRHAYLIPNNFRDVLIGGLLAPVAVMQMLRHTCDYSTYVGKLLTPTGLPEHVIIPVPPAITQRNINIKNQQG